MKDNIEPDSFENLEDMPPIIEEEILKESEDLLRQAKEESNYRVRKSIEELQESRRLHDLIDDYDFDGLDDED